MNKHQRYRLKDLDGYRARKREYAKTPAQRAKRNEYQRLYYHRSRKYNARTKALSRARYYANRQLHLAKARVYHLRSAFGLSVEQYDRMLTAQGGVCAICRRPPAKKRLHVDHCHGTGRIRGLLCGSCNGRLGWLEMFSDNIRAYPV